MPYQWVSPQVALRLGLKEIYHTYKDDDWDNMRLYWYTTNFSGSDGSDSFAFDIRDFDYPKTKCRMSTKDKLHYLIDKNLIKFP